MKNRIEYIYIEIKGRPPFVCYSGDMSENLAHEGMMENLPSWISLTYHQCKNCLLTPDTHPYCPMCLTLYPFFSYLSDVASTEKLRITIKEVQFTTQIRLTAQESIPIILPYLAILSDCHHWRFNRWAYRYFSYSSDYESWVFKALSIALIRELTLNERLPDRKEIIGNVRRRLAGLKETVESLIKRIRGVMEEDAGLNALISGASLVSLLAISADECIQGWAGEIRSAMSIEL